MMRVYSLPRQNFVFAIDGLDKAVYLPAVINKLREDVVAHVLSTFDPVPVRDRWLQLRGLATN